MIFELYFVSDSSNNNRITFPGEETQSEEDQSNESNDGKFLNKNVLENITDFQF